MVGYITRITKPGFFQQPPKRGNCGSIPSSCVKRMGVRRARPVGQPRGGIVITRGGAVLFVIPAKAGIHLRVRVNELRCILPHRCAGTLTKNKRRKMDSGFRRNDGAFARSMNKNVGITLRGCPSSGQARRPVPTTPQSLPARGKPRVRHRPQGHARSGYSASPICLKARQRCLMSSRDIRRCASRSSFPAFSENSPASNS